LPQNFPLLPISPLVPPSLHFSLILSPKLRRAPELEEHKTSRRCETQGLRKVESSMLKECEKEKARGAF
jgi:hypothetical protein